MFNVKQGIIKSIDGFTIGMEYQLNNGYYKNKCVKLIWIALKKQLSINGERYRQIRCMLLENKKHINSQLDHLAKIRYEQNPSKKDLSMVSNKIIILLTKKGNKEAKQEFIRRFKKLPKINK